MNATKAVEAGTIKGASVETGWVVRNQRRGGFTAHTANCPTAIRYSIYPYWFSTPTAEIRNGITAGLYTHCALCAAIENAG